MSEMESLEDMLAALESPSGNQNDNYPYEDVGDIDSFLDQIEEEARSGSTYSTGPRGGYSTYEPRDQGGQSTYGGKMGNPKPTNQTYSRPQSQIGGQMGGGSHVDGHLSVNVGGGGRGAGGGTGAGNGAGVVFGMSSSDIQHSETDLRQQGYELHHNKGKWFNPGGGNKASDFRIKGTTSTKVKMIHAITLRSLDDHGNPTKIDNPREFIGCVLTHRESGNEIIPWFRDNGDCTYDLAFISNQSGTIRMEIKLCGNPMFDINIQVEDIGRSKWVAKPRLPVNPGDLFVIDIVTTDGSRPEGVAPFEVQTMGDVENLKLINNGDGTYKFQCVPQSLGHVTVQLTLHGQPLQDCPITIAVGEGKKSIQIKQESSYVHTLHDDRQRPQSTYDTYDSNPGDFDEGYGADFGGNDVSNDDLNALLDELSG